MAEQLPIVGKLRAVDDVEMGGVCEVTVLRNPDGPEAADTIEALFEALDDIISFGGLSIAKVEKAKAALKQAKGEL